MAGWTRRWRIDSREKLLRTINALAALDIRQPLELVLRTERVEKTAEQRKLFHAICAEIAPRVGYTPGGVKLRVKASFYGVEIQNEDGVYYSILPSSEDSDREEYSRLIDHAYQWAAEAGHPIPDRRPR